MVITNKNSTQYGIIGLTCATGKDVNRTYDEIFEDGLIPGGCYSAMGEDAKIVLDSCDEEGRFSPAKLFPRFPDERYDEARIIEVIYGIRRSPGYGDEDDCEFSFGPTLKFEEFVTEGKPSALEVTVTTTYKSAD